MHCELSLVYPLMRGVTPLITAVLGILWLLELPAPIRALACCSISVGVIALARGRGKPPLLAGPAAPSDSPLQTSAVIATYTSY